MGTGTGQTSYSPRRTDVEVTHAAMRTYGKLLAVTSGRVSVHPTRDGGLICEDRTRFARPAMWQILPDGSVLPDRRYSFVTRGFATTTVPPGLA